VTVTPDPLNMLALAVPLWGLYEVGILLCGWPRFRPSRARSAAQ
jgi:Sec-independent protein secretion pathway component TatC